MVKEGKIIYYLVVSSSGPKLHTCNPDDTLPLAGLMFTAQHKELGVPCSANLKTSGLTVAEDVLQVIAITVSALVFSFHRRRL
jgi:hypothetical protein